MAWSENKCDGVMSAAGDNKDDGVVSSDADDAGYDQPVSLSSIRPGAVSGYKGPGNTALSIDDPRMS